MTLPPSFKPTDLRGHTPKREIPFRAYSNLTTFQAQVYQLALSFWKDHEIADALNSTERSVNTCVRVLRAKGYTVPYQKKLGRPQTYAKRVNGVRLSEDQRTFITNYAASEKISLSEAIRLIIEFGIESLEESS